MNLTISFEKIEKIALSHVQCTIATPDLNNQATNKKALVIAETHEKNVAMATQRKECWANRASRSDPGCPTTNLMRTFLS
jgi:hypothetical protein